VLTLKLEKRLLINQSCFKQEIFKKASVFAAVFFNGISGCVYSVSRGTPIWR